MKELEDERLAIQRVSAEAEESINKIEKKKHKLGKFMESQAARAKHNTNRLMQEAETLKDQLKKLETSETDIGPVQTKSANSGNPELLQFIDRQIESLKRDLECPVCFEIASSPIFKCDDDHLICSGCRAKVTACPQCREPFPRGPQRRFRGAERQAEKLTALHLERATVSGT
jgi:DNA repair exonuclease SbcCD ATPase subunit